MVLLYYNYSYAYYNKYNYLERKMKELTPLIYTKPDKSQFELHVSEQTKSAKLVFVDNA